VDDVAVNICPALFRGTAELFNQFKETVDAIEGQNSDASRFARRSGAGAGAAAGQGLPDT
jgi:hypothetical protein